MSTRRLFKNSFLALAAKLVNAMIQIGCLPVLLKVFGKENYGLIVIAMSLNTFVAIIQLGLPTGIPKFVAEWLARGEHKQLNSAMRTVSSFYIAIALVNALFLLGIALFWPTLFNVNPDQMTTLQALLILTAITSFLSIPATALDQALTGAQELGFVSSMEMVKNVFFGALVAYVYFRPEILSITHFYALRCIIMFLMVPAKLWKWVRYDSLWAFVPGWDFKAVWPLLKYCLSLMVFGMFLIIANKLPPIILAMRTTSNAADTMTDYQILNYVQMFLLMLASSFMTALIPHISGGVAGGHRDMYKKVIIEGTKIVWVFGALVGFGVIMLSREAICIYVGGDYLYLQKWLIIFVAGILYNLYNPAMASAILASGKMTPMIFATSIGCVIALSICWGLAPSIGVGSIAYALIGFNFVVFMVNHFWYFPKFFHVNPFHQIIYVLMPPVIAGVVMCLTGRWLIDQIGYTNNYINIAIGAVLGTAIYSSIILAIYIRPTQVWNLAVKLKKA